MCGNKLETERGFLVSCCLVRQLDLTGSKLHRWKRHIKLFELGCLRITGLLTEGIRCIKAVWAEVVETDGDVNVCRQTLEIKASPDEALCSVLFHTAMRGGRTQLQLLHIKRSVLCTTASFIHSTCRQNLLCLNDEIRASCPCFWTQTGSCQRFPPLTALQEPNRSVQSRPLLVTHPNMLTF